MLKILSTLVAVSLVGPATLAFADDSAAAAKKAAEEAMVAGDNAEKAGEKAEQAGDRAQSSKDARHQMKARHQMHARQDRPGEKHARQAVGELQRADPGLTRFFDEAAGYAVFPTVGKGGMGIGGARGTGVLYEKGVVTGKTSLTQLTVGLQLGGQAYTEVIFFETEQTLAAFKKGEFAMAAQVSAVAAKAGASANARYVDGVSVFTLAKGGVMAEASVGGQKFSYHPFQKAVLTSSR